MEAKKTPTQEGDLLTSDLIIDHQMDQKETNTDLDNHKDHAITQTKDLEDSVKASTPQNAKEKNIDVQMSDQELDQTDKAPRKKSMQIVTFSDKVNVQSQPKDMALSQGKSSEHRKEQNSANEDAQEEPEAQKIGLRRQSTRTKTAKNNSDYIYFSKYKEIGAGSGPENSSKNGTNPGANESKKRKYSVKKNQCDQDKLMNESAKSAKSASFHLDRDTSNIDERQIQNDSNLIQEVGLYPQSCGENCDQSSIVSQNSQNLGISAADFSISQTMQKKFKFRKDKNLNMSQADAENIQDNDQVLTGMQNQNKADQKKDAAANQTASITKQNSPKAATTRSDSKAGLIDKSAAASKSQAGIGQTSKEAVANQQPGIGSSSKAQQAEQKTQNAQPVIQAPIGATAANIQALDLPVYCICRSSDENFMICCDRCEEWYHYKCLGLSQEEFESLTTTEQPFFCKQKECLSKEKKLKQIRAKEEAAEKRRQKLEEKKKPAMDKADKNPGSKKKKTVPEIEVEGPTGSAKDNLKNNASQIDLEEMEDNTPKNPLVQNKSNLRQPRDSKAKAANPVPRFAQLPKDSTSAKTPLKKQKNEKASKTATVTGDHSNDQFATESNLEIVSAGGKGAKKKRDKKQEQKLTEQSRDGESCRDKSKKQKKDKKQEKQAVDKKVRVKSKHSDSEKAGKETKKQKTIFVQPGQTNPLQMKMFPMGLQGLGGMPPLGMMPPMMGGMNHSMGFGSHLANLRAHQMLQMQLATANKPNNAPKLGNAKAVPSLNLLKGLNNAVGMKRPAIPLEPLNLLGNLMGKKEATSQKRATGLSQDQSSSKISVSDNNSANNGVPAQKNLSSYGADQQSEKDALMIQQEGNPLQAGMREASASQMTARAVSNSQGGPLGKVTSVYESDNHYHMVLKNSASTKAQTQVGGDSEEAPPEFAQEKEFVFKKVDLYLENKASNQGEDFQNLFNLMNIKTEQSSQTDLDNIIEQLCSPEGCLEVEKIAEDNEALPEFLNQFDISKEDRDNLKLLSRTIKLQKIIDRIHTQQTASGEQVNSFRGLVSQQQSPASNI